MYFLFVYLYTTISKNAPLCRSDHANVCRKSLF